MSRPIARAVSRDASRTLLRRWLLLGAAVGAASLLWASAARAQDALPVTSTEALVVAQGPAAVPSAAGTGASPVVTSVASSGPRQPASLLGTPATRRLPLTASPSTEAPAIAALRQDDRPGFRRNIALVVVGLAAVVIGSEVDDGAGTVLILGGAGLSLYGLYQILK